MTTPNPADNVSVKIDELAAPLPEDLASWIMAANSLRKAPDKGPYHKLTCEVGNGISFELYAIPTDEDLSSVHVVDASAFIYPEKTMYFSKGYPLRDNGSWCVVLCFVDKTTSLVTKFKLRLTPA